LTRLYSHSSVKRWYSGALTLVALFLALSVNAQGTVGIGTGTANGASLLPINSCYGYNYTQQIVTASEYAAGGGVAGNITKIRYYNSGGAASTAEWNNWTVYLGHTAKTAFASTTDWEPFANLTQVFTGTIAPVTGNWFEITFTTPFNYNGTSNLIVAIDENVAGWSCTAAFGSYASTTNSGIYYRNDSTNPDPAAPPTATGRTATLPRIQFEGMLASCLAPTGVTAVANNTTGGTAAWTASATAPAGGYDYYVSATNTAPTAGTTPTGNVGAGILTTPLSGLTANTTYYVWVRSHCSDTDMSTWAMAGAAFTTPCDPTPITYNQGFNATATPACWTTQIAAVQTVSYLGFVTTSTNVTAAPQEGTGFVRYNSYNASAGSEERLISAPLSSTGVSSVDVEFYWFQMNGALYNTGAYLNEGVVVQYSVDNGATWTTAGSLFPRQVATAPAAGEWSKKTVTLPAAAANQPNLKVALKFHSEFGYNMYADNLTVQATPTCTSPAAVTIGALTVNTAQLSWTASASAPANGYDYYVSATNTAPAGSATPTGSVGAGVLTAIATGLASNTTYYAWVRSNCGGIYSSWTASAGFTTPCDATDIDYFQNFESVTTPAIPVCTSIQNAGTGNNWTTSNNPGYGFTNKTLQYTYSSASAANAWFFTQGLNLTAGTSYRVTYKYGNNSTFYNERLAVGYGMANNAAAMTVIQDLTAITGAVANTTYVDFVPATTGVYYVGFNAHSIADQFYLYVDDISVTLSPPPPAITSFTPATYCAASGDITITGTSLAAATLTIGGTAVPITTNTNTQIVATVPQGVTGTVTVTTSTGTATSATSFSVVAPTALVLSGTDTDICSGFSSSAVTITSGASAYDTYVWTPSTGVTGSAAAGWVFNPGVTTEYVLTASQSAGPCVVNVTYEVTVNPLPAAVTVTAAADEVCFNGVVALTGNGGNSAVPLAYCTPAITQSGDSGDYIMNFSFAGVVNNGSSDAVSDYTYYPAMTASVVAGASNAVSVQAGASFGQTFRVWIDFNQDGTFSADESVFSTATSSTAVQTGTITVPATAYNGTTRMRVGCKWNAAITATEACGHTGYGEYEDYNINITGATNAVEYVWTPSAGLYTDAAATVAYVAGATENMVYAKVTAPVTYTATATSTDGCSASGSVSLDLLVIPAPTGAASQTLCYGAPVSNIAATGESLQYYTAPAGGTALSASTAANFGFYYVSQTLNGCESTARLAVAVSINLVAAPVIADDVVTVCNEGTLADLAVTGTAVQWYTTATDGQPLAADTAFTEGTTIYYASQTVDGCESPARTAVAVMLTITDAPVADEMQTFCNSATVADLSAEGTGVLWYADETGGDALAADTALENDVTYYAAQTTEGCTSAVRTAVMAMINVTPAPVAVAEQTFCNGAIVASLEAEGDNVQWYTTETNGQALESDVALEDGAIYYASLTVNGCEGIARTAVTVSITTVIADTMEDVTACFEYTLPELTNGAYYTEAGGSGDTLAAGTVLAESTTVYIYAATGDCSDETSFAVTISATPAPEAQSPQIITVEEGTATVEDIFVAAQGDVTWYASEEDAMAGTNPLEAGTAIEAGATYYATQTIDGCTSQDVVAVTISEILGGKAFDARTFSYYPNPVKDLLNLQYSSEITSVTVYNLLGQVVLAKQPNATTAQLDMAPLSEGTYMVTVTAGDAVKTIKVVKKLN
jgi:large repetitive protein